MEKRIIKRYSLSKQVSDRLEKMIENGTYKIDSKIPTEVELMELFDVSRNTIREAIQSLVSAGILEVKQGDGTYVRSNNRFDANMKRKLSNVNYDEINEARKLLEITIAQYAAERRNEEELNNIKLAFENRQKLKENEKENTLADIEFHLEIAKSCHNVVLLDLYKSLYSFLILNITKRKSKTNLTQEEIDDYHLNLYKAIENKDGELSTFYAKKILDI